MWANLKSKIYHFSGTKDFGTTKEGAYMWARRTLLARKQFRAARSKTIPHNDFGRTTLCKPCHALWPGRFPLYRSDLGSLIRRACWWSGGAQRPAKRARPPDRPLHPDPGDQAAGRPTNGFTRSSTTATG